MHMHMAMLLCKDQYEMLAMRLVSNGATIHTGSACSSHHCSSITVEPNSASKAQVRVNPQLQLPKNFSPINLEPIRCCRVLLQHSIDVRLITKKTRQLHHCKVRETTNHAGNVHLTTLQPTEWCIISSSALHWLLRTGVGRKGA